MEKMIGHHVAQGTGRVVVRAPVFDPHGFRHRDLHVIDVAAIPQRLENTVGESEHQDVLHRFFAEVVIDAIDLWFLEDLSKLMIESPGGFEVAAKRFFDDYSPPVADSFLGQTRLAQPLDRRTKQLGGRGQIEKIVAAGVKNNAIAAAIIGFEDISIPPFSLRLLIVVWMLRQLCSLVAETASKSLILLVARGVTQPFYSSD